MLKSVVEPMNNSKNKLNSEIILIFHFNPNTHLVSILFNSVSLLASARNVPLMTLKLCSFFFFIVIFFTLNH